MDIYKNVGVYILGVYILWIYNSKNVGVDYAEFTDLNSPPVAEVNCDNRKAMGKERWHRTRLQKSTKMIT